MEGDRQQQWQEQWIHPNAHWGRHCWISNTIDAATTCAGTAAWHNPATILHCPTQPTDSTSMNDLPSFWQISKWVKEQQANEGMRVLQCQPAGFFNKHIWHIVNTQSSMICLKWNTPILEAAWKASENHSKLATTVKSWFFLYNWRSWADWNWLLLIFF